MNRFVVILRRWLIGMKRCWLCGRSFVILVLWGISRFMFVLIFILMSIVVRVRCLRLIWLILESSWRRRRLVRRIMVCSLLIFLSLFLVRRVSVWRSFLLGRGMVLFFIWFVILVNCWFVMLSIILIRWFMLLFWFKICILSSFLRLLSFWVIRILLISVSILILVWFLVWVFVRVLLSFWMIFFVMLLIRCMRLWGRMRISIIKWRILKLLLMFLVLVLLWFKIWLVRGK